MKVNTTNEDGFCETVDMLFSFEYQDCHYIVFDDDGERACKRITWSAWNGFETLNTSTEKNAVAFATNLLNRAKSNPEFYAMKGEHYSIVKDNETGDSRIRKNKNNPLMRPALNVLPKCLKWIVGMAFAWIYAWIYTHYKGIMWAYTLFPNAERETLIAGMYIFQFVAATLLFVLKKEGRSLCDFCTNAVFPLNFITLFGVMKSNTTIRVLIIIGLAVFGISFVIPKIRRAIASEKTSIRRQNFKIAFSRVYASLLACVVISSIASNIFGVTGYIYKSDYGSTFSDSEEVREKYKQATFNINENVWPTLSEQEKTDTLQSICDYECINQLGCEIVTVQIGYPKNPCVLGEYDNITRTIIINSEHMKEGHASEVLCTLLHETRHAWQNAIVDMYSDIKSELDDKYKNLSVFQQAEDFQFSFDTYQSGVRDFDTYCDQIVESDSREWANNRMMYEYDYYVYIDCPTEEANAETSE